MSRSRPPLRVGLRTPPWRPIPEIVEFARTVEELGFDTVSIPDSPMLWRDTMSTLTVLALQTKRVVLSTAVTNPVNRTPVSLASAVRTVAELAPGRFRLGIATGDSAVLLSGQRPSTIQQLRDAVELVRELLEGRAPFPDAPNTTLHDPPPGPVPILVAADRPKALAAAAEVGDGVITTSRNLADKRERLLAAASAAGRPQPYHVVGVSTRITDDLERDVQELKPFIAKYVQREGPEYLASRGFEVSVPGRDFKLPDGTDLAHPRDKQAAIEASAQWISDELAVWFAQNEAVWGDAGFVAARFVELWELGVDEVLARTDGAFSFPLELAQQLAADVLPRVRAAAP
jgi:5,10-methylenetetrahydromethanopterin reductase